MYKILILILLSSSISSNAGQIDKEAIRLTIKKNLKDIRSCRDIAAKANNDIKGKILLGWTIETDGHVENAKVSKGLSEDIDLCLISKLKLWKFPKPPDGIKIEVQSYPFIFR
ncbi:AgmX/PglI C-terminal domain-containing protein [bacterium]|nr:AgmX/PglI C-terminal domain-containing protein [bacterium]